MSDASESEPSKETKADDKIDEEIVTNETATESKVSESVVDQHEVVDPNSSLSEPTESKNDIADISSSEERPETSSVEPPIDKEPVATEQQEETEEKKAEANTSAEQPQYDEEIVEEHQNNALKILILAASVIVIGCIGGGYYLFKQIEKRDSHIELLEKQMKIVAQNQKKSNVAHTQHQSTSNPVDSLKASTAFQAKTAESVKTETEEESNEKALQVKYNRDPRIRTGAYIITGIKKTVTVRAGQTMNGISRTALGPGMECYVEAVNGGQRELKEGEKINIPSLKLKKRK